MCEYCEKEKKQEQKEEGEYFYWLWQHLLSQKEAIYLNNQFTIK